MFKFIEKFGGRKTFSWDLVTIIAAAALFTKRLSGGEWVTFTVASFALLGIANVAQKVVVAKQNKENKETETTV